MAPEPAPRPIRQVATDWLTPPTFADPELTQHARMLHGIAVTTIGLVSLIVPIIVIVQPEILLRGLFSIGVVGALAVATLALNRRGRMQVASRLYIVVILGLLSINALTAGGIRSPGVQAYFVFVMLAGLLLGDRAGVITAFACATLGLGLVLLESLGMVSPQPIYGPLAIWLLTCVYIGIALMTMRTATGAVRRSLMKAETELAERRAAQDQLKERVKELKCLYAWSQILSEEKDCGPDTLARLVPHVPPAWMYPEDCRARITYRNAEVESEGWRATPWRLAAPFETSKGRGMLEVVYIDEHPLQDEGPFLAEERALINSLAEVLSSHIERQATEERRHALEAQLLRTKEQAVESRYAAMLDERNRIARELHDTLLQGFTGVGLKLVAVANRTEGAPGVTEALQIVIGDAQSALESARRAIWDMRPVPHEDGDFAATLRSAIDNCLRGTNLECAFIVEGTPRPADQEVETAVFRVTLEAIGNVLKHADACTVRVVLAYEPARIGLTVTDDGRGFVVDPDFRAYSGHLGLLGMHERAGRAHGTLAVRSSPGAGTMIRLVIPLTTTSRIEA